MRIGNTSRRALAGKALRNCHSSLDNFFAKVNWRKITIFWAIFVLEHTQGLAAAPGAGCGVTIVAPINADIN